MGCGSSSQTRDGDIDLGSMPWFCSTYNPNANNLAMVYNSDFEVYTNKANELKRIDIIPRPPVSYPAFNISSLEHVQAAAQAVLVENNKNVATVVNELMNQSVNQLIIENTNLTDADKVRVMFYWLTMQNTQVNYGLSTNQLSISYLLNSLKNKETNHAVLFALMCSYADIPCVIVNGLVKGPNYYPGKELTSNHNREWNAVLIDGDWRLVDCLWGVAENPQYENEHVTDPWYLFPDPSQLIHSHFPDTPVWQLLRSPISKSSFKEQAFLMRRFFEMNMGLLSGSQAQLVCETGEAEVLFQLNQHEVEKQNFKCIVQKVGEDNIHKPVELEDDTVQLDFIHKQLPDYEDDSSTELAQTRPVTPLQLFAVSEPLSLSIKVRFPEKGRYYLEIIGRNTDKYDCPWTDDYDWIAKYSVVCKHVPDWLTLFPRIPDIGFGPNPYLKRCGLEALSHKSEAIKCFVGQSINMTFGVLQNAPTKVITMMYTFGSRNVLSTEDPAEEFEDVEPPERFLVQKSKGRHVINIPLCITEPGEHVLSVMATLNATDKGHVINYLVFCKTDPAETLAKTIKEVVEKLQEAITSEQLDTLKIAIVFARTKKIHNKPEVSPLYTKALAVRRMMEYNRSIPNIDGTVVANLRRYGKPDETIVRLFRAMFTILGDRPEDLNDWDQIRSKVTSVGKSSLNRRLKEFDQSSVTTDQMNAMKVEIGESIDIPAIANIYRDAGSFARWLQLVIDTYNRQQADSLRS